MSVTESRFKPAAATDADQRGDPPDSATPVEPIPRGQAATAGRFLAFAATLALVVAIANAVIGTQHYPNYATWTGIRPLEDKIRVLAAAAAERQPDALILGSSMSDFGFSAEYFGQLVSQKLGTDYRVFNFSSGATEVVTLPKMYRLARTVSHPRELILALPVGLRRPEEYAPRSPDYIMQHAPVGFGLEHPMLLGLDKALWDTPLLQNSTAIRDLFEFGRFANLPGQGSDLYRITLWGDTISFNYQVGADFPTIRQAYLTQVSPAEPPKWASMSLDQRLHFYFNNHDIDALREIRQLAENDGARIVVMRHGPAATFYPDAPPGGDYALVQQQYYEALGEALNARVVNDLSNFRVPQYAINDVVHLNRYGARLLTARAAASYLQDPSVADVEPLLGADAVPKLAPIPSTEPTVNQFASLIPAPTQPDTRTLRLHLIRNHAVPPLPPTKLFLAARLPSGEDIVAPADLIEDTVLTATFPDLPIGGRRLLLVRVLEEAGGRLAALNQPAGDYEWVGS